MSLSFRHLPAGSPAPAAWDGLRKAHAYAQPDDACEGERLVAFRGEGAVARLSLSSAPAMHGLAQPAGLIGHYESAEAEAGAAVLSEACRLLREKGLALALGPLHGSTWKRYRLALPPGTDAERSAPFLGEPENPERYPSEWEAAGFKIRERYDSWSIRLSDPQRSIEAGDKAAKALGEALKPLDPARYDEELRALYDEACEAFADNVLYSPISEDGFFKLYAPLKPLLDPRLVWLVRSPEGKVLGHVLAWKEGPRVILKNLAVRPAERGGRLGWRLVQLIHGQAAKLGAAEVIHALTHEANSSSSIARVYGADAACLRRYALYERPL